MTMKYLWMISGVLLFASCSTSTGLMTQPQVTQGYDEFDDEYNLKTSETRMYKGGAFDIHTISALASSTCQGKSKCITGYPIDLFITSYSEGWRLLNYHDFVLIIDGNRYDFGELPRRGDVNSGSMVTEYLMVELEYDVFKSLANSQSVKGKIGAYEFEWSYEHRLVFRMLQAELERS